MQQPPLNIPPQKDVLTLEKGKKYTENWRKLMDSIYGSNKCDIANGVFIPFIDITELAKLQKLVTEITKAPSTVAERIYIVGVRAYFSFETGELLKLPISAGQYPIKLVLVPVYQTNYREPGSPGEFDYDPKFKDFTYDLIVPVPSEKDSAAPGDAGDYSIYDITRPCPPLCDANSDLH